MALPRTIAETLLPLIFRRSRPGASRVPLGNDLPESGGYSGQMPRRNVLAAPEALNLVGQDPAPPVTVPTGASPSQLALPEETRPRRATPTAAPNVLAPDTSLPSADTVAVPELDTGAGRVARRVETDKRGRPTPNLTLQGDDQTLDYYGRLARMPEDTEGGGWWPKIRAALAGFAAGGPIGAAAGFGTRALREHFDPTLGSREYRAEKMAQISPAVEAIREARKDRRTEESQAAQTDLARARTEAIRNPKLSAKWVIKQDENGVFRPVNQATGLDPEGNPVKGRLTSPSEWELKVDDNGRFVPVNKRTGLDQHGRTVKARPLTSRDTDDIEFTNAQIRQSIKEAEADMRKIEAGGVFSMPRTVESTDILGNPRIVPNPEYVEQIRAYRKYQDDIRRWRQKLRRVRKGATASSKQASDDPLGLFEDDEDDGEP